MLAFKCFVEPPAVKLSTQPGFKSLAGDNQEEPRLGANGAGKSSFLDAIFFCAYGQGLKGQKASALQTWGCDIRPWVKTRWRIDKAIVEIERSGSPDKLLINGQPASQEDVDRILGLTRMRFRHSVIFGQKVTLFADLSIAERSALMEEVCDLSLWQRAADKADDEAKACVKEAQDHAREILRFETRLDSLPRLKVLRAEQVAWHEKHAVELEETEAEYGAALSEYRAMGRAKATERTDLGAMKKALRGARALAAEADRAERQVRLDYEHAERQHDHLTTNPNCPNCGQHWPLASVRLEEIAESLPVLAKALKRAARGHGAAVHAEKELALELEEAEEAQKTAAAEYNKAQGAYLAQDKLVRSLKKRRDEVRAETDEAIEAQIDDVKEKRATYKAGILEHEQMLQDAEGRAGVATYWKSAFKQVRLFQMKRVLQHLELEIEAAMNSLGLHGWKIELSTETENRSGTFKQGVQIQVRSPKASAPWESWSGGESQRLTLAIAKGFANMIKRMSGVTYTFEFWDEPSAWLSVEGIEDMIGTLRDRAEQERISLWLVDHRSLGAAFDETWVVRKNGEGSYVEMVG